MLEKEDLEEILEEGLKTGATFSEIFLEEKEERSIRFLDQMIKEVDHRYTKGSGLRLKKGEDIFYSSVPSHEKGVLLSSIKKLAHALDSSQVVNHVSLSSLQKIGSSIPNRSDDMIKKLLIKLDRRARKNKLVYQVAFHFYTRKQHVQIASSLSTHVEEERYIERLKIGRASCRERV